MDITCDRDLIPVIRISRNFFSYLPTRIIILLILDVSNDLSSVSSL